MSMMSITVGIPGSGKTYCAELMQQDNPDDVVLMSRDDFRHLFFREDGILAQPKEFYITQVMEREAKNQLRLGKHVIIHDTNLREKYRKRWAEIAGSQCAGFEIIDLTSVDLNQCLNNDYDRFVKGGRRVGSEVIKDLHTRFIKPLQGRPVEAPQINAKPLSPLVPYKHTPGLPEAIIVDLDGTVALCEGVRSPYDYTRVKYDKPNLPVIRQVQDEAYKLGTKILFVSGRLAPIESQCYNDTEEWLYEHVKVPIGMLAMRHQDGVDDTIIKYDIFDKLIRDRYNVKYVLDDRNKVVRMWRSINLPCWQVQEGDF